MMQEPLEVRVARSEERIDALRDGHTELKAIVTTIHRDIAAIKERVTRVDVKQAVLITVVTLTVNIAAALLVARFGGVVG